MRADQGRARGGRRLAGPPAEGPDGLGHVGRVEEAGVVGVDEGLEGGRFAGHAGRALHSATGAVALPGFPALLDEPEAR